VKQANKEIPKYFSLWKQYISFGDVVVDIGANIGLYSIWYSMFGCTVHAFEPSKYNIIRLKRVCEIFQMIHLHEIGLSDKNEICNICFSDCCYKFPRKQFIEFVEYDTYAKNNNIIPKFIKMDIEGMESVALFKMKETLIKTRPVWQIEIHPNSVFFVPRKKRGFDFNEFITNNYFVVDMDCKKTKNKIYPIAKREQLLFVPKERWVKNCTN
jgi:FkbM family methyltransferase